MYPLMEKLATAAARVKEVGGDFSFGKPDESDFVRAILAEFDIFNASDEFIEEVANLLHEDQGTMIVSAEAMCVFVWDQADWKIPVA